MVVVAGDPRTSNELIQTIFAAGLSATKGNVDQAADAGLKFFAELNKIGQFHAGGAARRRRSPRALRRSSSAGTIWRSATATR